MKKIIFNFAICLSLAGCASLPVQQTMAASPSVTQIQGGCFTSRAKFLEQASCINDALSHFPLNPYAQEYMAHLQSLSSKVKKGKISEDEARLQLTQALNQLRQQQQQEFQQQEAIESQSSLQMLEILKQNPPKPLEVYKIPTHRPTNTNCQMIGNQMTCTTY